MKKSLFLVFIALFTKIGLFAQTSELFPRYTVVDIEPTITGDKSLEQLQSEFQEQADKSLNGQVRVDYLVLPSGAIGDCRVNFTYPQGDENLAYEGKRFVYSLPKFNPGVLKGENVRTWKYALLTFGKIPEKDNKQDRPTIGVYRVKGEDYGESHGELFDKKEIETMISQMPVFPGGANSLIEYLSKNVSYPEECVKQKIEGRVLVEFVVEEDGSISSIQVKQPVHPLLDEEALRVIRIMPRWFPAMTPKEPVRVKYTVPITFKL
jgi:TonB family protein